MSVVESNFFGIYPIEYLFYEMKQHQNLTTRSATTLRIVFLNIFLICKTLTADHYGEDFLWSGSLDLWGGAPADYCTQNAFYGCSRQGSGTNYINPAQSAR